MQKAINNELLGFVVFIIVFVIVMVIIKWAWEAFKEEYKDIFSENRTKNVVKSDTIKCTNCFAFFELKDEFCAFCGIKRGETK